MNKPLCIRLNGTELKDEFGGINVPLAFGPRLADPVLTEKALAEAAIDFWEVCRPFLADPLLLRKLEENRAEEIKLGKRVWDKNIEPDLGYRSDG